MTPVLCNKLTMRAIFTFVFVVLVLSSTSDSRAHTSFCHVQGNRADCSGHGRQLTYIPKLGDLVNTIEFNSNYLPHVAKDTFLNISVHNIMLLSINNNSIHSISEDAFEAFNNLEELDISQNNISTEQLRKLLLSLSTMSNLKSLYLNTLSIGIVPQNLFSKMNGSKLKQLSFRNNNLSFISKEMLQPLKGLELLDLNNNMLYEVKLPVLQQLEKIHLEENQLEIIPNFCKNGKETTSESLTPVLSELLIRGNKLRYIKASNFNCLPYLNKLDLSENVVKFVPKNVLSALPNIKSFSIKYMKNRDLKIEPNAFNSSSLEELIISNVIDANVFFLSPNETFAYVPNVKFLDFSSINLFHMAPKTIVQLFNNLINLERLSLWGCKLYSIPDGLFRYKHKLQILELSNNYIKTISQIQFQNITGLRELFLRFNNIGRIQQNMFTEALFPKLEVLDLSHNNFACVCDLQWFLEWLHNHKSLVRYYPEQYRCVNPSNMWGRLLADVAFTYRECHPWGFGIWLGIVGGPTLCLLVVITAVIYRKRWNIRHYIFLLRKRRNYANIEGRNLEFDGFVGYSQHDYEWVVGTLLPPLEEQQGLKLCFQDRNFKPGIFILDNIIKSMDKSNKIIFVLTNEFAKCGWCTFMLKVAYTKHIEDETELVVVMLQKPEARYMNKSLKLLLQTTTYLEWTNDEVGRNLFWGKLKEAMQR